MPVEPQMRDVDHVDRPAVQAGMTPFHRVRPLLPHGAWAQTDPSWRAAGVQAAPHQCPGLVGGSGTD